MTTNHPVERGGLSLFPWKHLFFRFRNIVFPIHPSTHAGRKKDAFTHMILADHNTLSGLFNE